MKGNAIHHGGHAKFTDAVVNMLASRHRAFCINTQGGHALPVRQIGSGQIRRAAQHAGHTWAKIIQHDLRGLAARHGQLLGGQSLDQGMGFRGKILWQIAPHSALKFFRLLRVGGRITREERIPLGLTLRAMRIRIPIGFHIGGNFKSRIRPVHGLAGQRDFFLTQGLTMGLGSIGTIR